MSNYIWSIQAIPAYRVYRLYDNYDVCVYRETCITASKYTN